MQRRLLTRLLGWWRLWCAWEEVRHARAMLRAACPCCICRDYPQRRT